MKDIEKIKSEDLACQVADANPGNFGIEQEVAAMVGATVPAPTEPSADDARELPAQLLVFLRRALTPIQSAMRTALAAIYSHLDSRCTDYTPAGYASFMPLPPYDPMRPYVPRTLPNLLTAITAFAPRKISNGSAPNDGIPDGTSLAHILCGDYNSVTKLIDDNHGWSMSKSLAGLPNLEDATLNCKDSSVAIINTAICSNELNLPELESTSITSGMFIENCTAKVIRANRLGALAQGRKIYNCPNVEKIYLNGIEKAGGWSYDPTISNCPKLEEVYAENYHIYKNQTLSPLVGSLAELRLLSLGTLEEYGMTDNYGKIVGSGCPKLIDLRVGSKVSFTISNWNPSYVLSDNPTGNDLVTDEGISTNLEQFLQNFRDHIALRLTDQGSGLTLTLSHDVFEAIGFLDGTIPSSDIRFEIRTIIGNKGWKVKCAADSDQYPT